MCGITGFWEPARPQPNVRAVIQPMMALLHHRGPDGSGYHADDEQGLVMGHTRLSIIDLRTGDQPLYADHGKLVMTSNGELYDYKRIRSSYVLAGHRFATKSDSETALHHYMEKGLDFVHQLRGEFAIALFDGRNKRLVLVRDRFGVKPIYFHLTPERVVWGSECKAVLAHPSVPKEMSGRDVLNNLMHVTVPGRTLFRGIDAIEPGCMVIIEERHGRLESKTVRYWDLDFPEPGAYGDPADAGRYIQSVQDVLTDAVAARLEADVPVGCYLSGGIDSCSMLGLATALQQSPVKAFTISFDNKAYDETAIATEMAMSTRADQEVLELSAADLYGDSYVRTAWHAERTFYNTLGVAKWHMSKRVHECGYKVVVTGEGSDELFGGYVFFKRDYFLHGPEFANRRGAAEAKLNQSNQIVRGSLLSEEHAQHDAFQDLMGFTPSWIQPWMLTLERVRPLLSGRLSEELAGYDPVAAIADKLDPNRLRGRHPLDRAQYSWVKTMLEGQILTWGGDRVDMANSMESRPAFLDHKVADVARHIPPSLRISADGIEKWVLREAMRGVLPETLYKREKFAFMAPPAHTDKKKRAAIGELIEEHMSPERMREADLVDADRVQTFLDGYWAESDHTQSLRNDIILNHLLCLHLIDERVVGRAKEASSG